MAAHRGRPAGSGVVWPSAKTVYALRACAVLAAAYPDRRMKAAEIANESKVPLRFLSKILGEMRDAAIVDSRRGYYGGYVLERHPQDITVAELTRAISGYELFAPIPADRLQPRLPFVEALQCRLREVASEVLGNTSIADIAHSGVDISG
jgi:Rrf2 family cysteine metabolism transcriptional repressor